MGGKNKRGFVDGFAAGVVKLSSTMPLDTIKVQMQLRKSVDADYRTMGSSARAIVRGHGIAGLYTGLGASLLNQGGKTGVQFAAYQFWRESLGPLGLEAGGLAFCAGASAAPDVGDSRRERARGSLVPNERAEGRPEYGNKTSPVAGALAGLTEAFCWTTPIERIKTLRQAELNAAAPRVDASSPLVRVALVHGRIVANEFPLGLWRGTAPTMARQASGLAVRFLTYDLARDELRRSSGAPRPWHSVLAGAFSGAASAVVNHPVDVVKSRMQAEASRAGGRRQNSVAYTAQLLRSGGAAVFAHGLAPRVLKIMSGQAIVFGVYENLRTVLAN
jgi:solute carrier family 25 citrate transporter 1